MEREKKQKPYNPFTTRTIKRATVGRVKIYLRAVKPNPKNAFGANKLDGARYSQHGRVTFYPNGEPYYKSTVYYYEVGASDGSYRKCVTKEDELKRFEQLVEFEKRQTQIQ